MNAVIKFFIIYSVISVSVAYEKFGKVEQGWINVLADGEFPYVVSLLARGSHICSGTIIDDNYILTAADCVENMTKTIETVTENSIKYDSAISQIRGISEIILHKEYNPQDNYLNDIAIMKVEIPFGKFELRKRIYLPTDATPVDSSVTAFGWRISEAKTVDAPYSLKKVDMKIISNSVCQFSSANVIHNEQICAKLISEFSCMGDIGGPVISDNKIIGIISAYKMSCGRIRPRIFTRVSKYTDWIKKIMKKNI